MSEYVNVPREPTARMIEEGMRSIRCDLELGRKPQTGTAQRAARNAYVTMLAAAPTPPAEAAKVEARHWRKAIAEFSTNADRIERRAIALAAEEAKAG